MTEAEYVALSTAMRDVIYFMNLIDKMKNFGITLPGVPKPITTCHIFEDNVSALELANTPKLRPRTKHLAVQLHHFRQYNYRSYDFRSNREANVDGILPFLLSI